MPTIIPPVRLLAARTLGVILTVLAIMLWGLRTGPYDPVPASGLDPRPPAAVTTGPGSAVP